MAFPDGEWTISDGVVTEAGSGLIDFFFEAPLVALGLCIVLFFIAIPFFMIWGIYKVIKAIYRSCKEAKSTNVASVAYYQQPTYYTPVYSVQPPTQSCIAPPTNYGTAALHPHEYPTVSRGFETIDEAVITMTRSLSGAEPQFFQTPLKTPNRIPAYELSMPITPVKKSPVSTIDEALARLSEIQQSQREFQSTFKF